MQCQPQGLPASGLPGGPAGKAAPSAAPLRVGKGLTSMQNRKPGALEASCPQLGRLGAAAAGRGPARGAARGLTGVEVRAEGEAGVEEGRRHGQGQQRVLASPGGRCAQDARGPRRAITRPPQVRARLGRRARPAPTAAAAGPAGCGCGCRCVCGRRRQTRRLPRPAAAPRGSRAGAVRKHRRERARRGGSLHGWGGTETRSGGTRRLGGYGDVGGHEGTRGHRDAGWEIRRRGGGTENGGALGGGRCGRKGAGRGILRRRWELKRRRMGDPKARGHGGWGRGARRRKVRAGGGGRDGDSGRGHLEARGWAEAWGEEREGGGAAARAGVGTVARRSNTKARAGWPGGAGPGTRGSGPRTRPAHAGFGGSLGPAPRPLGGARAGGVGGLFLPKPPAPVPRCDNRGEGAAAPAREGTAPGV